MSVVEKKRWRAELVARFIAFRLSIFNWRVMAGVMLIAFGLAYFLKDYSIGIDANEVRCLPWRVYFLHPKDPNKYQKGDFVGFIPKNGLMGDKFEGRLVGKQIAALPGDLIEVKGDILYVNQQQIAQLNPDYIQKLHRNPGGFDRTEIVPEGRLLLLGMDKNSYDGRYWGTVPYQSIVGAISPIF